MADYERWFRAFNRNVSEEYAKMYFAILNGNLIQKRMSEIEHCSNGEDINTTIRAEGKNSDRVGLVAIKRATDTELNLYREVKERVERVLDDLDDEQVIIIHQLYNVKESLNKGRNFSRSISSVAKDLDLSTAEVKKAKNIFLSKIMS